MFNISPTVIRVTSLMQPGPGTLMSGFKGSLYAPTTDVGFIGWYSATLAKWVIVNTATQPFPFDCIISFNGDTLKPTGYAVHGYPAWVGTTYCIYHTPSVVAGSIYVAMPKDMLGHYRPIDESPTIAFWVYDGASPHTATFTHKGLAASDVTADINGWGRWESSTQFGIYTAVGTGVSGTKVIGLPSWKAGATRYTRSLSTTPLPTWSVFTGWVYGKYSYGTAMYDPVRDFYVIGTYGSESGWWSGDEPTPGYTRTFNFNKPEGSAITGSNIVLTWDGYVKGNDTGDVLVGETAIWRT